MTSEDNVRPLETWLSYSSRTINTALDPDVAILVTDGTVSGVEVAGVGLVDEAN